MDSKILIKNSSKSKAGQTETFSAAQFRELTIGRDPACDVKFDPNDDLVSRRHAKITKVSDVPEYSIADLGSRNGTLVNKRRIFEPTKLNCGDQVQLGPDGPQFEFDLDPRPASMIKPTRLSDASGIAAAGPLPPTRQTPVPMATTRESAPSSTLAPAEKTTVGKATVERMISETKSKSQKMAYIAIAAVLVVIGGVTWWLYATRPRPVDTEAIKRDLERKLPGGLSPTQIAQANTESTVSMAVAWKLIDTASGNQLYHVYIPNAKKVSSKPDTYEEIVPNGGKYLPAFIVVDGKLEPVLTIDPKNGDADNAPIGERLTGSGFVVSSDGFILTNRHVAASWYAPYEFQEKYGILVVLDSDGNLANELPLPASKFPSWIPENAKAVSTWKAIRPSFVKVPVIEGRNDVLNVTFAKTRIPIPAKLARTSDRSDVAMVKIDIPQPLRKVDLNDNYDTIKVGNAVVTLGYPGVSPPVIGVAASHDVFNQQASVQEIPDPTLSVGNIGRIIRGAAGMDQATFAAGDYYQLTINSTGAGNSGGPVFDDQGRVIAIFSLRITTDVTISGAIPIRYGKELMGVNPMEAK